MRWLRMLFKNKTKIYVEVDENLNPVIAENGLIRYRYQNNTDAAEYSTTKANLTLIPGTEPVDLDEPATKPPKQRKVPVTSVQPHSAVDVIPPNTIVAYTDGGASPNPGPAGSGILLMFGEHTLEIWEYLGNSTNNVAELNAILIALNNIKNPTLPVLLYSDSNYALGVLSGRMKPKQNLDLIEKIRIRMKDFSNLQMLKVKAHIGIAHNEHVDRLAALARDTKQSGSRRN